MSTIWIDVHYYPEREGGNSEVKPLVVKTDLNMKFLIIFRIFFTLFLFFIFNLGKGRKKQNKIMNSKKMAQLHYLRNDVFNSEHLSKSWTFHCHYEL
jgi:hypothetical protein